MTLEDALQAAREGHLVTHPALLGRTLTYVPATEGPPALPEMFRTGRNLFHILRVHHTPEWTVVGDDLA